MIREDYQDPEDILRNLQKKRREDEHRGTQVPELEVSAEDWRGAEEVLIELQKKRAGATKDAKSAPPPIPTGPTDAELEARREEEERSAREHEEAKRAAEAKKGEHLTKLREYLDELKRKEPELRANEELAARLEKEAAARQREKKGGEPVTRFPDHSDPDNPGMVRKGGSADVIVPNAARERYDAIRNSIGRLNSKTRDALRDLKLPKRVHLSKEEWEAKYPLEKRLAIGALIVGLGGLGMSSADALDLKWWEWDSIRMKFASLLGVSSVAFLLALFDAKRREYSNGVAEGYASWTALATLFGAYYVGLFNPLLSAGVAGAGVAGIAGSEYLRRRKNKK